MSRFRFFGVICALAMVSVPARVNESETLPLCIRKPAGSLEVLALLVAHLDLDRARIAS